MEPERRSSEQLNGDDSTASAPASVDHDQQQRATKALLAEVSNKELTPGERRYEELREQPDHVEKKFALDRRKLERLIIAGGKNNETAEEYFQQVMDKTGTAILWPSRLKIGAKSKKDPQVKVVGPLTGVNLAREILVTDLDTKSSKVTLKINIAHTEHSHIIGREGINIKKVHEDTQCHVHFPDTNRHPHGERSDQVSITGLLPQVEVARKGIRDLQPVVISLSFPLPGGHLRVDTNSPDMQEISQTYNVTINFKQQPRNMSLAVTVRGTVRFIDGFKLAVSKLTEYFTGDITMVPPVSMYLEVSPQHHRTILGREGGNVQHIMHDTCTMIQFPDPQGRFYNSQVVITGPLDNTLQARQQVLGCLPVALLFDVINEGDSITSDAIDRLMQSHDVFLSVKPKQKQPTQSVIIKSIEQNMECLYEARRRLIDIANRPLSARTALSTDSGAIRTITEMEEAEEFTQKTPEEPLEKGLSERKTSPSPPHPSQGPTMAATISPVSPPIVDQPLENGTEAVLAGPSSIPTLSVINMEVKDTKDYPSPIDSNQGGNSGSTPATTQVGDSSLPSSAPSSANVIATTSATNNTTAHSPISLRPGNSFSGKLTVRAFMDYDRKKEDAKKAMESKVHAEVDRYPTDKWAGEFLSKTMPPVLQENPTKPRGLDSLNQVGFRALMMQATMERKQSIQEQNIYQGITDLSTLLARLGLEKYEDCFTNEEIDLETFLTMSEDDLREIGISTLGSRRKLQIAISEIRKLQQEQTRQQPPVQRDVQHAHHLSMPRSSLSSSMQSSRHPRGNRGLLSYTGVSKSVRF